jgi:hypothetical protein
MRGKFQWKQAATTRRTKQQTPPAIAASVAEIPSLRMTIKIAGQSVERLAALSDGVFAVALAFDISLMRRWRSCRPTITLSISSRQTVAPPVPGAKK